MDSSTPITHVVLTRWKPDAPANLSDTLTPLIERFPAQIPGVVSAVHGASVSPEGLEGDFEWGLVVTFAHAQSRDGYLDHPDHAPVAELIRAWASAVVVFDVSG